MIRTMFAAGFCASEHSTIKDTRQPAASNEKMVNLVFCDTVIGVPTKKMVPWMLKARAGNSKMICSSEIDKSFTIGALVAIPKETDDDNEEDGEGDLLEVFDCGDIHRSST
ncbi:Hypothetical predicted protein [Octopus vulgaris]|uniref:Uncharacterized protein n=1 Tax=Octopus vulgaris TaxID=6645 RepID=A0AA36F5K7_OCTVU|nr:Hypothetical predicted protein [Octopus vulgaris]